MHAKATASGVQGLAAPGHSLRVLRPPTPTSLSGFAARLRPSAARLRSSAGAVCSASSDFVSTQSERIRRWAAEQRVQERVDAAAQAAAEATTSAAGRVAEAAGRCDKEWRVSSRLKTTLDYLESSWGLQRRARQLRQDVVRQWPGWRRQLGQFFNSPAGTVAGVVTFYFLLTTGLFIKLLNLIFILSFLAPVLLAPFAAQINQRVAEQMQRQAEEAQRAQRQQQFQSAVDGLFGGFGRQRGAGQDRRRESGGAGKTIDVEYDILDDK